MPILRELQVEELYGPGHRMCAGCGGSVTARMTLKSLKRPAYVVNATGCLEVATTIYPYTAWRVPWVHGLFENAPAIASGIETYLKSKNGGKMNADLIVFGGDGGTFDIGLQALSGAFERRHDFVYVCYDNEAYMNCLPGNTSVLTENGTKRVDQVHVGERLFTFDRDTNNLVLRKCSGVLNNGIRPVHEIATQHHLIRSTPNHPYLVAKRPGRSRPRHLRWKTLSDLRIGDDLVVMRKENWNFGKYANQHGYRDRLVEDENFTEETVRSLQYAQRIRTYDLRVEKDHNFIAEGVVVHNTGVQRSSATPEGAWTTTTPVGVASPGKVGPKKDLIAIALAHHVDYAATASPAYWSDFITKVEKAAAVEGPALIHAVAPCPLGWRFKTEQTIQMARLAVQTRYFPLYEVERGKYKMSVNPHPKPLEEFLKAQGRFNHLFQPQYADELNALKAQVEQRWAALEQLCQGKYPAW